MAENLVAQPEMIQQEMLEEEYVEEEIEALNDEEPVRTVSYNLFIESEVANDLAMLEGGMGFR